VEALVVIDFQNEFSPAGAMASAQLVRRLNAIVLTSSLSSSSCTAEGLARGAKRRETPTGQLSSEEGVAG